MPSRAQRSFPNPSHSDDRSCVLSWFPSEPRPGDRPALRLLVHLAVTFGILLAALSHGLAEEPPTSSQAPLDRSFVSVVGHGVVHGEPDMASLELGVTVTDADVREAVGRLDARIAAVMGAIRSLGVPEQGMRTTSFNVWREERYPQGSNDSPPTYRAHHMLRIEVDDAARAGEVLAAAVEAGANDIGGISFGIADSSELERQAREAAVMDARRKAQEFAEAAGVTLGAPVSIEEVGGSNGPPPMFERAAATVMSETQVAPGRLGVEVRVAISYLLERP